MHASINLKRWNQYRYRSFFRSHSTTSWRSRRDHPPTDQTPFPPTPTPPNSRGFKVFGKFLKKKPPDYREYSNYFEYCIIFRICGVKVSKIQVERGGGLGGWWVIPSKTTPPPMSTTIPIRLTLHEDKRCMSRPAKARRMSDSKG